MMHLPYHVSTDAAQCIMREAVQEASTAYRDGLTARDALAVEALGDAEAYRTMLREALAMMHAAREREAALQRQLSGLRDELRRYTAARVQEAA